MTLDDARLARLIRAAADAGDLPPAPQRYRIVREIGRGGMGIVYEAEDRVLDRRVALKQPRDPSGFGTSVAEHLVREALAAARLEHPNLCPVYDAGPQGIAMRLVDGVSIDALDDRDVRGLVTLLRDAARAVHAAHEVGLIHRDLKPANLMVEAPDGTDPKVFVMDFGLAKDTGHSDAGASLTGSLAGTPGFMAPEQARGEAVDPRTDVYGLGATLFATLTGRAPFEGSDPLDCLRKAADGPPPALRRHRRDVDRDLATVVQRALATDPKDRYPSAAAFADDLDLWLRHVPVTARAPSLARHLGGFVRRNRAACLSAAAAALLTATTWLFLYVNERTTREAAEAATRLAHTVASLLDDARDARLAGQPELYAASLATALARCEDFVHEHEVASGYLQLGRLHALRDDAEHALQALDHALALDPDLHEARFVRGGILLTLARRPESLGGPSPIALAHVLEQARADLSVHRRGELSFRQIDVLFGEAQLAHLDGDEQRALELLHGIVEHKDPYHDGALRLLGEILADSDPIASARFTNRAMDLRRGFGRQVLLDSGHALEAPGTMPGAPFLVDPPADRDAPDWWAVSRKVFQNAPLLQRDGRLDEARGQWNDLLQELASEPSAASPDPLLLLHRAACHAWLEELAESSSQTLAATRHRMQAIDDLQRVVALEPGNAAAWCNLGDACARHAEHLLRSDWEEAAQQFRERARDAHRQAAEHAAPASRIRERAELALAARSQR